MRLISRLRTALFRTLKGPAASQVLLVYPPVMTKYPATDPPFGIMSLAAVLAEAGIGVSILDLNVLRWPRKQVQEYFIRNFFPVVGVGGMTTVYYYVKWLVEFIKSVSPDTKIIGGGSFVSPCPELVLQNNPFDAVCIGEGEQVIVPLVERLISGLSLEGLPNVAWKTSTENIVLPGTTKRIENLDDLPFPAYDLVDMSYYLNAAGKRPALKLFAEKKNIPPESISNPLVMFSSRGCPFSCTFCYRNFGQRVVRNSIDYVFSHIRFVREKFGVNNIAFYDETFNSNRKWVLEFCRRAREELPDIYFWMGGARADLLDEDMVRTLKTSSFYEISIGVESFDDRILQEMGKGMTAENTIKSIRLLQKYDLAPSYVGMMYGFPGDDELSLNRSTSKITELGLNAYFQFPLPFPGTILYQRLVASGRIKDEEKYMVAMADCMAQDLYINISSFSDSQLVEMVRATERTIALKNNHGKTALASQSTEAKQKPTVALFGNIANNAFNMVNILVHNGLAARLIDDGSDTFAFSQPCWEEVSWALNEDHIAPASMTMAEWRNLEKEAGWVPGERVFSIHGSLLEKRLRAEPVLFKQVVDRAKARITTIDCLLDSSTKEILENVAVNNAATINTLESFDLVIAFGFIPALCAFLAGKPTIYFTYGGDMRQILANKDNLYPVASRCFKSVLSSRDFVIEAYGCDRQIYEILQQNGLARKMTYAFLPNINTGLFGKDWDKTKARNKLGWPEDKFVLLMPSRIDYFWKGADVFVDAYCDLAHRHNNILLVVIGWGKDFIEAKNRFHSKGVDKNVLVLPEIYSKPRLFELYAAADVIVDQFKLGSLGSVSFEAMCMGKPVLTYVGPFNQKHYRKSPPVINACTHGDICRQTDYYIARRDKLDTIGARAKKWYLSEYHERNLIQSVRILHEQGPKKWLAMMDSASCTLKDLEIQVPDHETTVTLKTWPYPYRAGLTIANDCEYYTWSRFCEIHQWLNNTGLSKFGPGLGLPISDSFWFYSEDMETLGFSYFQGIDYKKKGPYAPYLSQLIKVELLDVIHAYGGFDINAAFTRSHAEAALHELKKIRDDMQVWTNHGNIKNTQNLGGLWPNDYQRGDICGSVQYHSDLLVAAGIEYFWLDGYSTNRFSLGNYDGRAYENKLAARDEGPFSDALICRDVLRDGREIRTFRRFRGKRPSAPDPSSLAMQLDDLNLDHLEKSGGGAIIYQHLGCRRLDDGTPVSAQNYPLPEDAVRQMSELARRYHEGKIWVAPCAVFLRYLDVLSQLWIDIETHGDGIIIILAGRNRKWTEKDLAGVHIIIKGQALLFDVKMVGEDGRYIRCQPLISQCPTGERILSWPIPELPEFPFTGQECN